MVPAAEPRSYYERPVLKQPVWRPEVPWYFFAGGLGGSSATLAFGAGLVGNRSLARRSWLVALAGLSASPALLISDLGRPERFLNMLRVFKPTSPISVGSWMLTVSGTATGLAAAHENLGWFPRLGRVAAPAAAGLGLGLSTYTAALVANTAVPVWHEGRFELPFVFAGSGAASAGAAAVLLTPTESAGPARRLTVTGALLELAVTELMQRRLGELAEPYRDGRAGRYSTLSRLLSVAGAALVGLGGRKRRAVAVGGGGLVLAGAVLERWAVFRAGFQSAADPRHTVGPQRRRLEERQFPGTGRG
jgi:hypothetical protein